MYLNQLWTKNCTKWAESSRYKFYLHDRMDYNSTLNTQIGIYEI